MHTVLIDGLENLLHEGEIIDAAGRIVELVGQLLAGLAVNGETELADEDRGLEGVPQPEEVLPEEGGSDVDVGLGSVADVPAVLVLPLLVHAVREQIVGGSVVGSTGVNSLVGWGHNSGSVRVDSKEVRCTTNVTQLLLAERSGARKSVQDRLGILLAEENGVSEDSQLHLVEPVGSVNVAGVLGVLGNTEVVVELDTDPASSLQNIVIEVVYLSVSVNHIVAALEVVRVEQRLVESDPNRNTVSKVSEEDLSIVDKRIHEGCILVAGVVVTNIRVVVWNEWSTFEWNHVFAPDRELEHIRISA